MNMQILHKYLQFGLMYMYKISCRHGINEATDDTMHYCARLYKLPNNKGLYLTGAFVILI